MICYGLHVGYPMPTTKRTFFVLTLGVALVWTLPPASSSSVHAQDAVSVKLGEAAQTFAAGSIRKTTPQDGVVNPITGDNQTSGNRMLLGAGDSLYLRLKTTGDVSEGDLYTVFKRVHKVFHPQTGQYLGYVVNVLGIVRVMQVDPDLLTVKTVRAYAQISPGDPVVRFVPPVQEEVGGETRASGDVRGVVVDLQSDKNMTLIARGNIVYLDRGREDGLRPGDLLEVFRVSSGLPRRVVGEVKVLSMEDHTATALVSRATSQILRGDRFTSAMSHQNMLKTDVGTATMGIAEIRDEPATTPMPMAPAKTTSGFTVQHVGRQTRISLNELVDRIEYESGEVAIRPQSYGILDQIVEYLKTGAGDKLIRVEGHADNVEIGPSLKSRYPTNWELSKARATGVIRYLVEKGGFDSATLSAVGYGDTRPVATNSTEEGRRKNRRIEIVFSSPDPARSPNTANQPASREESSMSLSRVDSLPAPELVPQPPPTPASAEATTPAAVAPSSAVDANPLASEVAPGAVDVSEPTLDPKTDQPSVPLP